MSVNEQYFETLIAPIQEQMKASVWRILQNPDDAADAFQDALTTVWKRVHQVRKHPNPHALVLRICANSAYDALRRKARHLRKTTQFAALATESPSTPDARAQCFAKEQNQQIHDALGHLPRNQANALIMRLIQDQSYPEIAQAMGCSEATVRVHVMRGRARLQQLLAHLMPSPPPVECKNHG